jgi:hypothetical protein
MLLAWTVVAGGGTAVAAATKAIQPHRFLTLLVVGPVTAAVAAAIAFGATWVRGRAGRVVAVGFAVLAVSGTALLGGLTWYQDRTAPKQFFDATAFQQARKAAAYVDQLPEGKQVVFVVNPLGPFGPISTAEKERTIRAAMPPDRQVDVHIYPGTIQRFDAGRPTPVPNPSINRENLAYWRDVRPVLDREPAVLVLEAYAPPGPSAEHTIAPGVALLRGPRHLSFQPPEPAHAVSTTEVAVTRAVLILLLLSVAGLGWTGWFLGRSTAPLAFLSLCPTVGAGMLILASLLTVKVSGSLDGIGASTTFAAVTVAGLTLAAVSRRRKPAQQVADG